MELYQENGVLGEDEFLLKIRENSDSTKTGFLTKLNKDKSVPKLFLEWGLYNKWNRPSGGVDELPIYVFTETFRSNWKLLSWRFGESQNWATLLHPEGFTVEINLQNFLTIVKENTIENGVIIGEFKWFNKTLIKK